ncbi:hypothetical protein [Rhizobium sullae]|uniref:hypothetical protein n=1 Tax=Rhizobium sullae TaxID=50338 RepID=UPI001FCD66C3|nr:hypothetical protein [Rhizobium sullae]
MTEEWTTSLRERIIEDMRIRGIGDKAQQAHIRAIKDFARFLKRSPHTATPPWFCRPEPCAGSGMLVQPK